MNQLLMIGGGGHCSSILDCVLQSGSFEKIGIIDVNPKSSVLNVPVIGTDADLPHLFSTGWNNAFISVGSVGSTSLRRKLYLLVKSIGYFVPNIIDESAVVSKNTSLGEGIFIGKRAVINAGSRIGTGVIINTGAIVEHDCMIGDFVHISPGTTLCGQVSIGNDSHIGAGSVVRECIHIGSNSMVGAGSVVVKDISENVKAYGNPCRVVE